MVFLDKKYRPKLKKYLIQAAIAVLIIVAVLVLDLTTKSYIQNTYLSWDSRSLAIIEGFFYITYTRNTGGAWSLGSGCDSFMSVVIVMTIIFLAAMVFLLFYPDRRKNALFTVSAALLTAGAAGNLVDRMSFGYVRDFLDFNIFGYDGFPIFNFADVSLVVGVIMMIVIICIYFFRPKKSTDEASDSDDKAA